MRELGRSFFELVLNSRSRLAKPPEIIVMGLGNPGQEYANTRHNVGFWCVDLLAQQHSLPFKRKHKSAHIAEGEIEGKLSVLAKPRTFVNRSGSAAASLLTQYRVEPDHLLIIYDDIDLTVGTIRIRKTGGSGGHNGVKSIIKIVGTRDFTRIRIGIGRPENNADQIKHVLGKPSIDDLSRIKTAITKAAESVSSILTSSVDTTMNRFN